MFNMLEETIYVYRTNLFKINENIDFYFNFKNKLYFIKDTKITKIINFNNFTNKILNNPLNFIFSIIPKDTIATFFQTLIFKVDLKKTIR